MYMLQAGSLWRVTLFPANEKKPVHLSYLLFTKGWSTKLNYKTVRVLDINTET